MSGHHIPWFNPREMDDATVLALSTGRGPLLEELLRTITERLVHPAPGRHWLVTGTRGAGKSYFLRLAQSHAHQRWRSGEMRLVLLPEELPNVFSPHQFLDEISRMVRRDRGSADVGQVAAWRVPDPAQAWKNALAALLTSFDEPLLVVGIENYTELLRQVFTDEASAALLRKLMAEEPRLMLLATAVDGSVDEDYNQILFRQFEHHALPAWDEKLHRAYLGSRARLMGKVATRRQLARIDAYSRYTGGNARIAGVLAGAILEENDLLDTGADLNAALDKMSDYYREQLGRMPPKTRGLFDALVRGGDPCSQTQLADRVGARQNEISRPFLWMIDAGYLNAERDKGERETRYRVADRLFVQWYRMRYLEPGQRARLAVMAELLADMVEEDKTAFANCLRQLGDAVADTQRQQGPSAAFALGRQILQHFADDPSLSFESLLRGYFIDMIDMDVTPGVLHDLLAEVPELAGEQRMTTLAPLLEVLGAWITDLTRTADERASARKKMDPDLATTLDALTHELPLKTRIRLGLAKPPELSPEADALFNRILRQIGRAAGRNPPPISASPELQP